MSVMHFYIILYVKILQHAKARVEHNSRVLD